jgi:hypothetical protein
MPAWDTPSMTWPGGTAATRATGASPVLTEAGPVEISVRGPGQLVRAKIVAKRLRRLGRIDAWSSSGLPEYQPRSQAGRVTVDGAGCAA